MTRLETLCQAIQKHEGWAIGTASWRNNNPGNLRYSKFQTGTSASGFAIFPDYKTGLHALWYDLYLKCTGGSRLKLGPKATIKDLIYVYAPPYDQNNTDAYVKAVCDYCGVSATTLLSYFTDDINEKAQAKTPTLTPMQNVQIQISIYQKVVNIIKQLIDKFKKNE